MSPLMIAALGLATTAVTALLAMRFAVRLGFIDRPGTEAHKRQSHPVPYGGGFAVAVGLAVALGCAGVVAPQQGALLIGAAVLLLIGAWDDRKPMTARCKLELQSVVAAVVVGFAHLTVDSLHGWYGLDYVVAWAWLVAVTNAYNLIDHADGISGTVGVISAGVLLIGCLLAQDLVAAGLWAALVGALLGFLVWNRPPARIYLGDAGSMPLGFLIGGGALTVVFWPQGQGTGSPLALLAPFLIVALPLFDSFAVVVKRFRRGLPIMRGDRNHISHRLNRLGLSPWATLAVIAALQLALAAGAIQLRSATWTDGLATLVQSFGVLVAVVLLETMRDSGEPR